MTIAAASAEPGVSAASVYRNKRRDSMKAIFWDGDGLVIWYKRLERGSFQFPTDLTSSAEVTSCQITAEELSLLLDGIDLGSVQRQPRFALPAKLVKTRGDQSQRSC